MIYKAHRMRALCTVKLKCMAPRQYNPEHIVQSRDYGIINTRDTGAIPGFAYVISK